MQSQAVILLHGIARTKRSMATIEKSLKVEGLTVLNLGYRSTQKNIYDICIDVFHHIESAKLPANTTLHFVAYSMGCLIVRELLAKFAIQNVGNIVLIAPPNHGSEVADFLEKNILYRLIYGPAGQELTTHFAKSNPFPSLDFPFGVIAGNSCIDPISYFILPKGNDGKVTIESTKLTGMLDHIILPCSHTFIIHNQQVIKQIKHFLKHQNFMHTKQR